MGYHPHFETPLNPWNPGMWSGDSSSGSGGLLLRQNWPLGLWEATQAAPAASRLPPVGVVGLKPTWGRVSRYGVLALAESLDHVGPLTRSSADAAVMLQAIAGHDPKDPTSLPDPVPDMVKNMNAGVKGVRLGFDEQGTGQHADAGRMGL